MGVKKKNLKLEIKKNEFKKYYIDLRNKNEFGGKRKCLFAFKFF